MIGVRLPCAVIDIINSSDVESSSVRQNSSLTFGHPPEDYKNLGRRVLTPLRPALLSYIRAAVSPQAQVCGQRLRARMRGGAGQGLRTRRHGERLQPLRMRKRGCRGQVTFLFSLLSHFAHGILHISVHFRPCYFFSSCPEI